MIAFFFQVSSSSFSPRKSKRTCQLSSYPANLPRTRYLSLPESLKDPFHNKLNHWPNPPPVSVDRIPEPVSTQTKFRFPLHFDGTCSRSSFMIYPINFPRIIEDYSVPPNANVPFLHVGMLGLLTFQWGC